MQKKFTLKNLGGLLKLTLSTIVLMFVFAGTLTAQCTWTAATVYPIPAMDMPTATVGTNMYAFTGVSNGGLVAQSNKFDGTAWSSIAPTPAALEFPSATSDGTNIFIIGGTTGTSQTTNYRYNVATNTYSTMAPCAVGTWSHAAVFLNGRIYKIGGIAAGFTNALEIYNVATNSWTAGASYPISAGFISAVSIGNFIYAAGGNTGAGTLKTYRYDPATNVWDDAAIADLPATRWGAAHSNYRNGFVIAGGYVAGDIAASISTSVLSWDPLFNAWNAQPALVQSAGRMTGAILNDNFYVVGGRPVNNNSFVGQNNNQKFTCPPLVACAGTPNPGNTFSTNYNVCPNTPFTLTVQNNTSGTGVTYQWQSSPTLAGPYTAIAGANNPSLVVASITANTYYQLVVTCGTSSGTSNAVLISFSNCTCLNPQAATICEGTVQKLSVSGTGTPGTASFSSGPIAVVIPDANPNGTTATIPVTLPAGASITSMAVNFNINHTWDGDLDLNIVGPNGKVLNMVNSRGGSGDNFTNTVVNSTSTTSFATAAPPFTGTFRPDAGINQGPTAFPSTEPNFTSLYGVTNGNWRMAMSDDAGGDIGTLTLWGLNFSYSVLPTAVWTGGTFFLDQNMTIPYIAGSQANTVYVMPSTTTTYTATIASGPCTGANPVTVTVNPRPVVTVTPTSGCGPVTLTASGAATYMWSPATGLNTTTGPTVIANPNATTIYSVVGTSNAGCQSLPATATVNSAPTASVITANTPAPSFQINEGFSGAVQPPAGWAQKNNSTTLGTNPLWNKAPAGAPFPAFSGGPTDYITSNFNAVGGTGTISNWLFTPVLNLQNGDQVIFRTRTTTGQFPDRLQVRLSTNGASVNVGTTDISVGDYTTLLLDINPNLTTTGYPIAWTQFTATISGLPVATTGRVAFRYFVTNGGNGANSDYIGLDDVQYATPNSVNCPNVTTSISVAITGGVGPFSVVYSNGTTNTTINNYTSGAPIQVSPAVTTTYTIVSVTGSNGCVGTGNSGSATITITPAAAITTQPASQTVCSGSNATFTVAATPATGNNIQWQVSIGGGTFTNLTNTPPYSGVNTPTLTITGVTAAMDGYRYRAVVTGVCGAPAISNAATLNVNNPAVITAQPVATSVCASPSTQGATTTFSVTATGNTLTYQWQVSTDGGTTYTNVADNANYSGATTSTLTITNVSTMFNNYLYRVIVTSGGCTGTTSSAVALTVKPATQVVLSAAPYQALFPGLTTTLTAAVSPSTATSYTWFYNGAVLPGVIGNSTTIGINGVGSYFVRVNDANGCGGVSNTVVIRDSANSTLFIYPSPTTGVFQVRYFNDPTSPFASSPRSVVVYDSKGARVYASTAVVVGGAYGTTQVNLANHGKGVYRVDLVDSRGNRLKTGSVTVL